MSIKAITPPEPFVTPADIAGSHSADDEKIAAMIAAATEEIDGYAGWLGRCLAPQLLEWTGSCGPTSYPFAVPIGPLLEIVSVEFIDAAGSATVWPLPSSPDAFVDLAATYGRARRFRIQYWAGYGQPDPQDASKWVEQVPARAKQAVIMSVQHMKALGAENLFLRSETVEGIGQRQYIVSEQAGTIIRDTAKRLLSGLKVPRI